MLCSKPKATRENRKTAAKIIEQKPKNEFPKVKMFGIICIPFFNLILGNLNLFWSLIHLLTGVMTGWVNGSQRLRSAIQKPQCRGRSGCQIMNLSSSDLFTQASNSALQQEYPACLRGRSNREVPSPIYSLAGPSVPGTAKIVLIISFCLLNSRMLLIKFLKMKVLSFTSLNNKWTSGSIKWLGEGSVNPPLTR